MPPRIVLLANTHHSLSSSEARVEDCPVANKPFHPLRTPTALLASPTGECILDQWRAALHECGATGIFIVTSGSAYKSFERWATASDFPVDAIINDGSTNEDTSLGPAASLALWSRRTGLVDGAVLVVAADAVVARKDGIAPLLTRCLDAPISFAVLLSKRSGVDPDKQRGWPFQLESGSVVPTSPQSDRDLTRDVPILLLHAPALAAVSNRDAVAAEAVRHGGSASHSPSLAHLVLWLTNHGARVDGVASTADDAPVCMVADLHSWPAAAELGSVAVRETRQALLVSGYRSLLGQAPTPAAPEMAAEIVCRANARVGVMGNPSDGFHGKTISMSISNFWAEVRLWPSERLAVLPHPLYDVSEFGSLADLACVIGKEGYEGGVRLLLATCKRFHQHCTANHIPLRPKNCTLAYDTNVPRQVGLAGSSAIITCTCTYHM